MYRKSRFLVGLTVAAITFGSLWFTMGPEHFNRGHRICEYEHCRMHEDFRRGCCGQFEKSGIEKVVIIRQDVKTDSIKR